MNYQELLCRWAQQLGGMDLLPLVQPETSAGEDSKDALGEDILPVLRKQQRALALIELLRTAKPSNAALRYCRTPNYFASPLL